MEVFLIVIKKNRVNYSEDQLSMSTRVSSITK